MVAPSFNATYCRLPCGADRRYVFHCSPRAAPRSAKRSDRSWRFGSWVIGALGVWGYCPAPIRTGALDPRHASSTCSPAARPASCARRGIPALSRSEALYRRHGPFGATPIPPHLECPGPSVPGAGTMRGRAALVLVTAARRQTTSSSAVPPATLCDGDSGHRRHHHRQPGPSSPAHSR